MKQPDREASASFARSEFDAPAPRVRWGDFFLGCGWLPLFIVIAVAGTALLGILALRTVRRTGMADRLDTAFLNISLLPAPNVTQTETESQVQLYYLNQGRSLAPRTRLLPHPSGLDERLRVIAHELEKPVTSPIFQRPLPDGVSFRGIYLYDGIVWVNIGKEVLETTDRSPLREQLMIYGIVNSLMQNDESQSLQGVRFLIDGQLVETAWGWLDLSAPLGRDLSIIRE